MNRAQRKGTAGENAVVASLLPFYPLVGRRARQGNRDRGDIGGIAPGLVIEVKAQPSAYEISRWLGEADVEAANDNASLAVVWFKLRGKGNPLDWPVMMRGRFFIPLLQRWTDGLPDGRLDNSGGPQPTINGRRPLRKPKQGLGL